MFAKRILVEFNPLNGEILASQLLHFLLNGFEIAFSNRVHSKIVVESTVNGRTDGGQCTRVQFHHGLSEKVGCGMAKDVDSFLRIRWDAFHRAVLVQCTGHVAFHAVDLCGETTVFLSQGIGDDFGTGDAGSVLVDGSIGQRDVNQRHALRTSRQPLRG